MREQPGRAGSLVLRGRVVTPGGVMEQGEVVAEGHRIAAVRTAGGNVPKGARVVDAGRWWVVPGFIDVHVHGGGGTDVMDQEPDAIGMVVSFHAMYGTTGLLPTSVTRALPELKAWLSVASRWVDRRTGDAILLEEEGGEWTSTGEDGVEEGSLPVWAGVSGVKARGAGTGVPRGGAAVLGLHLEGPYLNEARKGAHARDHLRLPRREELKDLLTAGRGTVRLVTLAPELPGAGELLDLLREEGVIPALGHSDASLEDVTVAADRGLRHVTHTFNAMRPFHHRDPGATGAVLLDDRLTCEAIADGVHLHPQALRLLVKVKGPGRVVLVTDAMRAAGLADGIYRLGGHDVEAGGGRTVLPDGKPAGSLLTMNRAVQMAVEGAGVDILDAVHMASAVPARLLGLADRKGTIEEGKDADLVVVTPQWRVALTIVGGRPVWFDGQIWRAK